jgi:hypothetical protein
VHRAHGGAIRIVAGHDLTWRGVEFGQVAVPGALVAVQYAWITTYAATGWDVEALAVRNGSPINVVWVRLEIAFGADASLSGGLVLKLPADRSGSITRWRVTRLALSSTIRGRVC